MKTLIEAMAQATNNRFNFDKLDSILTNNKQEFLNNIKRSGHQIQHTDNEYIIHVSYDRNTEKLTHSINERQFNVVVETLGDCQSKQPEPNIVCTNTRQNKLNITLPEDVDERLYTQKYDSEQKKMIFTFSKVMK